jgi:TRAP-type transport system periplasmic protein
LAVTIGFLAFDKRAFDKLTPADQALVNAEIEKAFTKLNNINFDDAAARAALIKQGVQTQVPSADQAKAWEAVGTKSLAELSQKNAFSKPVLDAVLAARAEFRAQAK